MTRTPLSQISTRFNPGVVAQIQDRVAQLQMAQRLWMDAETDAESDAAAARMAEMVAELEGRFFVDLLA